MNLLKQSPFEVKTYLISASKFVALMTATLHLPIYMAWFIKYHGLWKLYSKNCTRNWNAVIFANYCFILFLTLLATVIIGVCLILLWLILPVAIEILVEGRLETDDQRKVVAFLISWFYEPSLFILPSACGICHKDFNRSSEV